MSKKNNKYSGTVTAPFKVGGKTIISYEVGDSFTTNSEEAFKSLIFKNRIKP